MDTPPPKGERVWGRDTLLVTVVIALLIAGLLGLAAVYLAGGFMVDLRTFVCQGMVLRP